MKFLSLFSGACGGWDLGMQRAGYEPMAACEADPWRRAAFAKNFPDVRLYDDVRALGAARLLRDFGFLPSVIVGSPPCQDASSANANGKGVDGERTGLFFEAIRIIAECRPVWCCLENVPGLRTRGVDRVLAGLEEAGYAVWPLVVGAVHVGAPHRRNRVWIVAADLSRVGRGPGAERRPDTGASGQPEQALQDASLFADLAGDGGAPADADGWVEPDRRTVSTGRREWGAEADAGAWAPADASGLALWQQPGRCSGADGAGAAEPRDDGPAGAAADADEARRTDGCLEPGLRPAQDADDRRAFAQAWPDWNGGFAGFGRVDARLSAGLAEFCRNQCGVEGWEGQPSKADSELVSAAAQYSSDAGSASDWRTDRALRSGDIAPSDVLASLTSLTSPPIGSAPNGFAGPPAKFAGQPTGSTPTTSTATCRTTGQRTSKPCAGHVTCAITGKRVAQACASLGEQSPAYRRAARQCIAAYGDAVVPQIPEAIGRVMRRLMACSPSP